MMADFAQQGRTHISVKEISLPGVYTYAQGAFRLVNWRTLYDLPYVKPMRIRIGENVAAAKLVQKVDPVYPAEAPKNKVSRSVVLHVVEDMDGHILQIQPVSGPPELLDAAIEAVKQWRYSPTLLNGDPVQVDTLIEIVFSLH
jgi:hypothetical protein